MPIKIILFYWRMARILRKVSFLKLELIKFQKCHFSSVLAFHRLRECLRVKLKQKLSTLPGRKELVNLPGKGQKSKLTKKFYYVLEKRFFSVDQLSSGLLIYTISSTFINQCFQSRPIF